MKRLTGAFGSWTLVCDEVTRLKQRVCSMRTLALDPAGAPIAIATVSTGDDGRPAAMVQIAAAWATGTWVEITPIAQTSVAPALKPAAGTGSKGREAGKKAEPTKANPPVMKLRPVTCDAKNCTLVWTLAQAQITALNSGDGLRVHYLQAAAGPAPATGKSAPVSVTGTINASGFAQAVNAAVTVVP